MAGKLVKLLAWSKSIFGSSCHLAGVSGLNTWSHVEYKSSSIGLCMKERRRKAVTCMMSLLSCPPFLQLYAILRHLIRHGCLSFTPCRLEGSSRPAADDVDLPSYRKYPSAPIVMAAVVPQLEYNQVTLAFNLSRIQIQSYRLSSRPPILHHYDSPLIKTALGLLSLRTTYEGTAHCWKRPVHDHVYSDVMFKAQISACS